MSHRPAQILALAACLAGCGSDEGRGRALAALDELLATAAGVSGDVEVKRAGAPYWEDAPLASTFRAGDWVRTSGAGARARLELVAGGRLELEEGAVVILDGATPGAAARVAVETGAVRGTLRDGAPALAVRSLDGTEMSVRAATGGPVSFGLARVGDATELRVEEGEAIVDAGAGEVKLVSGGPHDRGGGGRGRGTPPPTPARRARAPDARVRVGAGGSLVLRWRPVDGASGYRVQLARDLSFEKLEAAVEVAATEVTLTPRGRGMVAWRVAARDRGGRAGEWGFVRRVYLERARP